MVTRSADVVVLSPGGLLPKKKSASPALAGLATINKLLTTELVEATVHADRFRTQMQDEGYNHPLDESPMHRRWLPHVVEAVAARDLLRGLTLGTGSPLSRLKINQADASALLHYLFGAMGRRRNDGEAAAKLAACVDVFSPASNALGSALGLWKPAPTHPVILAVTIKRLMSEKTFEPSEAELREALATVNQRMKMLPFWIGEWIERLDEADRTVFKKNPPAWQAAYANVGSSVLAEMLERADVAGEGPCEDEDENDPPSPRWKALKELYDAKFVIDYPEQAKLEAEERAALAAEQAKPPPQRIAAACKRDEAKRSKKPEGQDAEEKV